MTPRAVRRILAIAVLIAASSDAAALKITLSRPDIERALALARWPRTDAERAQFHAGYIVPVHSPTIDSWTVEQVEVITEFRRLEMIAEEHARLNDLWGRAGLRDVEEAIRPHRGRVSIVVRLGLRTNLPYVGGVPPVELVLSGPDALPSIETRRTEQRAYCGGDAACPIVGALVEAVFDAAAIGQSTRPLLVLSERNQLARVPIDFGAIE